MAAVKEPILTDPLLKKCDVAKLLGCTVRTLERKIACNLFPAPMKVCGRSHLLRWRKSTVVAYLDRQEKEAARS